MVPLKDISIGSIADLSDILSRKVNDGTLSTVATSGSYQDLVGKPSLGSAAQENKNSFATAEQGLSAETLIAANVHTITKPITAASINEALRKTSDAGGGVVLLPPGEYTIEASIGDAVSRIKHTQLVGAGKRGINGAGVGGTLLTASVVAISLLCQGCGSRALFLILELMRQITVAAA